MSDTFVPETPSWVCPECNRTFKNQSALMSHAKTHVGPISKPDFLAPPAPTPAMEVLADAGLFRPVTGAAPQVPTGKTWVDTIGYTADTLLSDTVVSTAVTVKVKKLPHYGNLPNITKATDGSAGFDLYAAIRDEIHIRISSWQLIPTGLAIEIPRGWVAKIVPRSGLAFNNGITILNTPGIIDSDYRGEIKVNLVNNTTSKFKVQPGMRIAQMLIERSPDVKLEFVEELTETVRGAGGFGSTGKF